MIPAIDVPAAGSRMATTTTAAPASNNYHHIKEEEDDDEAETDEGELNIMENQSDESQVTSLLHRPKLIEKSVIVHRDENGFGLRVKGQAPVFIEHVHENGAAWRAGVRQYDQVSKVNGTPVTGADHKEVVLMFKSCTRFVGITLVSWVCDQSPQVGLDVMTSGSIGHCRGGSSYALKDNNAATSTNMPSMPLGSGSLFIKRLSTVTLSRDYQTLASSSNTIGHQQHKLKLGRLQHPNNYNHSFSSADSQRPALLNLSKLRLPNVSLSSSSNNGQTDSGLSLASSPLAGRQSPYERQQAMARRSESVTHRPSYLMASSHESITMHQRNHRHQHQHQVVSVGEPAGSEELPVERLAVCIHCRAPTAARRAPDGPLGGCCQQCAQLNYSPSTGGGGGGGGGGGSETTIHQRAMIHQRQTQLNDEIFQARQRSYGSLRDPRGQPEAEIGDTRRNSKQQQQQLPRIQLPKFKLTHSDSISSLNPKLMMQRGESAGGSLTVTTIPSIVLTKQPSTNKRLEIIREFIDTEKAHTERLRCLDELFYGPLKVGGFMTAEQLRMVFSCHRTLYKIHRQIYRTLLSSNQNLYAEPLIGSALIEIFEGDLKRRLERAACSFCSAQSTNVELLNKLTRRDTKVGEFLAHVTSQQMVGRLGIKDLLASCFQRLTKYPLLLENLLKATPQSLPAIPPPPPPAQPKSRGRRTRAGSSFKNSSLDDDSERGNRCDDDDEDDEDDADEDDEYHDAIGEETEEDEEAEEEALRNSRRMLAISLAEEREFIERALNQSRQMLIRVNDSVKVAISRQKLREIWKRTDKYPGVPLIDITKQQVIHEGLLTLRLSKRSFDVYVLLLNDYLIILTREGQDKYRLKFFTPDGKSSATSSPNVYSPVFVIDEHLTTRDAATDENGFYLLCKRKDDSRIYEFASRSPAERLKWRDRIQWAIERQISKSERRGSYSGESTITKSSSELSAKQDSDVPITPRVQPEPMTATLAAMDAEKNTVATGSTNASISPKPTSVEPTKIEGTISYVEDDGIVMPSKIGSSRVLVDQAIQVTILDPSRKAVITN